MERRNKGLKQSPTWDPSGKANLADPVRFCRDSFPPESDFHQEEFHSCLDAIGAKKVQPLHPKPCALNPKLASMQSRAKRSIPSHPPFSALVILLRAAFHLHLASTPFAPPPPPASVLPF